MSSAAHFGSPHNLRSPVSFTHSAWEGRQIFNSDAICNGYQVSTGKREDAVHCRNTFWLVFDHIYSFSDFKLLRKPRLCSWLPGPFSRKLCTLKRIFWNHTIRSIYVFAYAFILYSPVQCYCKLTYLIERILLVFIFEQDAVKEIFTKTFQSNYCSHLNCTLLSFWKLLVPSKFVRLLLRM